MKKVLNSKDWMYEDFVKSEFFNGQSTFVFRNRRSNEVILLQQAKYFIDGLKVVVHFDALRDLIFNVSDANLHRLRNSNPQLATHVNSLLNVSATKREPKCVLNALLANSEGR